MSCYTSNNYTGRGCMLSECGGTIEVQTFDNTTVSKVWCRTP